MRPSLARVGHATSSGVRAFDVLYLRSSLHFLCIKDRLESRVRIGTSNCGIARDARYARWGQLLIRIVGFFRFAGVTGSVQRQSTCESDVVDDTSALIAINRKGKNQIDDVLG